MTSRVLVAVLSAALVAVAACDSGDGGGGGAGGSVGGSGGTAGTGGDAGGGGTGGTGGSAGAPAQQFSDVEWTGATATLPGAIDHHVSFAADSAAGPHVYFLGGVEDRASFHDEGWMAKVQDDGTLGAWEEIEPIPDAVGGHAVAVVGNRVIVIGGRDRTLANLPDVYVGTIGDDGRIDAWEEARTMPGGRFHSVAVVDGRWLYVVGGIEEDDAIDTVLRAELKDDGTLGEWTQAATLPAPRSHHAAVVHDGSLYVLGGLDGDPMRGTEETHGDVWRARLSADGSVGTWETLTELPNRVSSTSAQAIGDAIFLFGGIEGSSYYSEHVRRAEILPDGTIGDWTAVGDLPTGRAHVHQLPRVGDRLYSLGGSTRAGSIDSIVIGQLKE